MLAADRLLLETNMKQKAIQLREKELNLFVENFSSIGTQAAVLAGFIITCFVVIAIPDTAHVLAKGLLHFFAIFSICANIICVSMSTIVTVWGSGMALRGAEGSMDEAVDGMNNERGLIFKSFAMGLFGNLCTVTCACWILMDTPLALVGSLMILYAFYIIATNTRRISQKFSLGGGGNLLLEI